MKRRLAMEFGIRASGVFFAEIITWAENLTIGGESGSSIPVARYAREAAEKQRFVICLTEFAGFDQSGTFSCFSLDGAIGSRAHHASAARQRKKTTRQLPASNKIMDNGD